MADELAARQLGLLTTADMERAGKTRRQLSWGVERRRYKRLRRNVVAIVGAPVSWLQAVRAVIMAAGPGVLATGWTAARLWGCRIRVADAVADAIEVLSANRRRVRIGGVRAHRSQHLFDADCSTRHGIPCVSAARLVVELSSRLTDRELGALVDDLLRRRLVRLDAIHRCVSRLPPAPGRSPSKVHAVLAARWPGYHPGDSDLETRVLRLLVAAGLPIPRQQFRVGLKGRRYFDLAWPELRLAIEIDSVRYHGDVTAFVNDRIKGNEAILLGWTLVRVADVMTDQEILDQILPVYEMLARG